MAFILNGSQDGDGRTGLFQFGPGNCQTDRFGDGHVAAIALGKVGGKHKATPLLVATLSDEEPHHHLQTAEHWKRLARPNAKLAKSWLPTPPCYAFEASTLAVS